MNIWLYLMIREGFLDAYFYARISYYNVPLSKAGKKSRHVKKYSPIFYPSISAIYFLHHSAHLKIFAIQLGQKKHLCRSWDAMSQTGLAWRTLTACSKSWRPCCPPLWWGSVTLWRKWSSCRTLTSTRERTRRLVGNSVFTVFFWVAFNSLWKALRW